MSRAKRYLFLTHRWAGIALCLLFAMWFFSGVVMMYVGYPKLTPAERLRHLPNLQAAAQGQALLSPQQAVAAAGVVGAPKALALAAASGGVPVYLVTPPPPKEPAPAAHAKGHRHPPDKAVVIDARSGERLGPVSEARVMQSAQAFATHLADTGSVAAPRYLGTVQEDAFTHSRSLDAHRPLHKVALGDEAGRWLYLSSTTGEVVRDATATERVWNFLGAWIHWLYPFRGNWFDPYWADIVNWLSIAGIVMAITGTVIGILRWRFNGTYASGSRSPYRSWWMRWHHLTGLAFALITFTWIFSGLMSMNPWKVLDSPAPPLKTQAYAGGSLDMKDFGNDVNALLRTAEQNRLPVRELVWARVGGEPLVLARDANGSKTVLKAAASTSAEPAPRLRAAFSEAEVTQLAPRLLPDTPLKAVQLLREHDFYYYDRAEHTMLGHLERPLPVWRVQFADAHNTWVHIDPQTGQVITRVDNMGRVKRVVFALLHSWDWLPLLARRPLWDVVMVLLSLGGLALSVTGVVIGWRRLMRPSRHGQRPAALPTTMLSGGDSSRRPA